MALKAFDGERVAPSVLETMVRLLTDSLSGVQRKARRLARRVGLGSSFRAYNRSSMRRSTVLGEAAGRDLLCGALWCLGGMLALAVVYAAVPDQNVRLLWLVIIVFGAIPFLRGLHRY